MWQFPNYGEARSNHRVNPPVRTVTVLAEGARPAPARPAGYAKRSADKMDVAAKRHASHRRPFEGEL